MVNAYKLLLSFVLIVFSVDFSRANQLPISDFSNETFEGWEEKTFSGKTLYTLVTLDDMPVLMAKSEKSASVLFKKTNIDISKYPYLNWSWRVENKLTTDNEKTKSGDDYAARVYVLISGGLLPWKTKAVNYVWAHLSEKYDVWPSAFAGKNSMMVALRNSDDGISTWYHEKRNVFDDLRELFGKEFTSINGVAIMTDTDNNNDQVTAYYGNIYFSMN